MSKMENETDGSMHHRQSSKLKERQLTQRLMKLTGLLFFIFLLVSKRSLHDLNFIVQAQECKEHQHPFNERRELATAASLDPDDILEGHG